MKKIFTRTLSLLSVASLLIVFAQCGDDDPKTAPEKDQLAKLSGTWNIVSAELDGVDATAPNGQIHDNFTLTISGTFDSGNPEGPYSYSISGTDTPSPWPASGTWEFSSISGDSGQIIRDDGVGIDYVISSSGVLTLTFTCSSCDYAGARTEQVNGDWVFELN